MIAEIGEGHAVERCCEECDGGVGVVGAEAVDVGAELGVGEAGVSPWEIEGAEGVAAVEGKEGVVFVKEGAAWSEEAVGFAHRGGGVGDVFERLPAENEIEAVVLEGAACEVVAEEGDLTGEWAAFFHDAFPAGSDAAVAFEDVAEIDADDGPGAAAGETGALRAFARADDEDIGTGDGASGEVEQPLGEEDTAVNEFEPGCGMTSVDLSFGAVAGGTGDADAGAPVGIEGDEAAGVEGEGGVGRAFRLGVHDRVV